MDFDLRDLDTCVLPNLNRLAETQQETLPCHGTLDHFAGHVGHEAFGQLRTWLVRSLIRQLFGSLRNIARRLLECFRYRLIPNEAYAPAAAACIQIRLDHFF